MSKRIAAFCSSDGVALGECDSGRGCRADRGSDSFRRHAPGRHSESRFLAQLAQRCPSAPDHCRLQSRVAGWNAAGLDFAPLGKSSQGACLRRGYGSQLAELSAKRAMASTCSAGGPASGSAPAKFCKMYPGVNIVGHHAPPLADLERMDHGDALERIRVAKPDILLVAFGNPKQEKWIRMHARRFRRTGLDRHRRQHGYAGGRRSAALPCGCSAVGLEWLGRCAQEPSRLLPRYARNFCPHHRNCRWL
jgi:hypothetical protein